MVTATSNAAATSAAAAAPSATGAPVGLATLSQDTFLKLMLAQMKNQDPFHAQDPSQFLTQLAQFTQVSGIQSMQTSLNTLSGAMRSSSALQATALVGHEVLAAGTTAQLDAGGSVQGAVDVPAGATAINISIRDSSGAVVRSFGVAPTGSLTNFAWDGAADDGTAAAPGTYQVQANAIVNGSTQSINPLLQSRVTSVTVSPTDGSLTLNTPTATLTLADVRQVM